MTFEKPLMVLLVGLGYVLVIILLLALPFAYTRQLASTQPTSQDVLQTEEVIQFAARSARVGDTIVLTKNDIPDTITTWSTLFGCSESYCVWIEHSPK